MLEDTPALALHENVIGFDLQVVQDILGHLYEISTLRVNPRDAGFSFVRRPRIYVVLTLKTAITRHVDPRVLYEAMVATASREEGPWPTAAYHDEEDLCRAENEARSRQKLPPLGERSADWRYLLSPPQAGRLAKLEEAAVGREATAFAIDLHPSDRFTRVGLCLPTLLRSSANRIWLLRERRWLVPREVAMAMGFPVSEELARRAAIQHDQATLQAPVSAIGDAMHVANAGCAIACILASCRLA